MRDRHHQTTRCLVDERVRQRGLGLGVEVGRRLVQQEHGGIVRERPSDRDALPLPPGEAFAVLVEKLIEAFGVVGDDVVDARPPERVPDTLVGEIPAEGHVLANRARHQRVLLRHVRDPRAKLLLGDRRQRPPQHSHRAGAGPQESERQAKERRLSASARTGDDDQAGRG